MAVEQRGDRARIRIRLVERSRQQGAGDRPRVRVNALCQAAQLQSSLLVEDDVDSVEAVGHSLTIARDCTNRAPRSADRPASRAVAAADISIWATVHRHDVRAADAE
jgi:hypothetical protein